MNLDFEGVSASSYPNVIYFVDDKTEIPEMEVYARVQQIVDGRGRI